MSSRKFLWLLAVVLISVFTSISSIAQTAGSVRGKLIDTKKQAVAYATLTLLRADSSVGGGDLSKDDGTFNITPVTPGNYSLRIEAMGYSTKWVRVSTTPTSPDANLGTLKVEQTATNLNAVEITGEKAAMEMKIDKKVFNVERNTTTVGGSAADVLQNVPAVSVDGDGNVSLRGKSGVTVLIDGKPATLLGPDLTQTLASMPAASISNIEVITNPSAKYDAQGSSGIINIITKKDNKLGMNGSVTAGAGTRDKYNGSLNFNVRKGKWSTFLNSSFRSNRTFNNITTERIDSGLNGNSAFTYEHAPRFHSGFFNTIGATYDLDKNNSLTFTGNVNKMGFGYTDASEFNVINGREKNIRDTLMHQDKYTDFAVTPFSVSGSLDYKHKFKKKDEELSIDATYSIFNAERKQNIRTVTDTMPSALNPVFQSAPGHGGNNSLNVWADYTNPLTANGKLGIGFKSQLYSFTSASDNPTIKYGNSAAVTDVQLVQTYDYTQQIHAGYVNWSDMKGKLSYQVGLRVEDAIYNGTGNVPTPATFHNSFFNFFPSAFVAYQLPNQQSVYINYSRRVNRPNFFQMMPFKDFSNPGVITMGNPNIEPEFIHNIELSYNKSDNKGNNIIVSGYFARTDNLIERVTRPIDSAVAAPLGLNDYIGMLLSTPVNVATGTTFGLEGTARLQLMPMWDATISGNLFQNMLDAGNASPYLSNNSGIGYFAKANTNVKLSKTLSIQLNGNYESPKVIAQGSVKESYWMDVAVKKNLWKNKATLTVNCSDVFKTRRFITINETVAYEQVINRVKETRIGNISFTYRFGKNDFGKNIAGKPGKPEKSMETKKPVKPNGDEDRQNNLKQSDDDNGGGGQGGGGRKQG
jgi:iron complex outermembrane receptor protein